MSSTRVESRPTLIGGGGEEVVGMRVGEGEVGSSPTPSQSETPMVVETPTSQIVQETSRWIETSSREMSKVLETSQIDRGEMGEISREETRGDKGVVVGVTVTLLIVILMGIVIYYKRRKRRQGRERGGVKKKRELVYDSVYTRSLFIRGGQ